MVDISGPRRTGRPRTGITARTYTLLTGDQPADRSSRATQDRQMRHRKGLAVEAMFKDLRVLFVLLILVTAAMVAPLLLAILQGSPDS